MRAKDVARRRIAEAADSLVELSHRIHANPEVGFEEVQASAWLARELERGGFDVDLGVFELPTALIARTGRGALELAICAEYDALPEIGHACGHNLIAAIALGAGLGLRELVDDLGITLTIIGTPAEEFGNGKALLLERGGFDDVDAALMVHPAPVDIAEPPLLAIEFDADFAPILRARCPRATVISAVCPSCSCGSTGGFAELRFLGSVGALECPPAGVHYCRTVHTSADST